MGKPTVQTINLEKAHKDSVSLVGKMPGNTTSLKIHADSISDSSSNRELKLDSAL